MVDISTPFSADGTSRFVPRTDHPVVAGGLVVSVVALLIVFAREAVDAGWAEAHGVWLLGGAALCIAANWAILARVRLRRTEVAATPLSRPGVGRAPRGVRRHVRYVPTNRVTALHMQDGRRIGARIVNISLAAVAIEAKMTDLDYMSVLRVGSREVGPIRRTPTGAVFGFTTILDPCRFDRSFVL